MNSENNVLKFSPIQSFVDQSFWHVLASKKINEFKLNEGPYSIYCHFNHLNNNSNPNHLFVDMDSFREYPVEKLRNIYYLKGSMWIFNTIEKFRTVEKNEILNNYARAKFLKRIQSKKYLNDPEKICNFISICFGDMKKYQFYFWFAFPMAVFATNPVVVSKIQYLNDICTDEQIEQFFLMFDDLQKEKHSMFFTLFLKDGLIRIDRFIHFDVEDESCILSFCDTSNSDKPCSLLRNILFAICTTLIPVGEKRIIRLLCYKQSFINTKRDIAGSYIMNVELTGFKLDTENIRFVGWEKNSNDQLLPKVADLSKSMDPLLLASNAVDLNLKLMKWRLMPELDLDSIFNVKCLLLGSGTLGCNVARQLLAWNVSNLTMVDSGNVSYSNPVRQSLFTFEQSSASSGMNKADAAADTLRKIYPKIKVTSHNISIPMPGHSISANEMDKVKTSIDQLTELIKESDVIFLLLDTREARWLPSMLGCFYGKIVMNAALGFDTYLVMRHGVAPAPGVSPSNAEKPCAMSTEKGKTREVPGDQLGCYFCTDVVGPANSTRDRTLDQQCTVTRPGVSMIAAALAVELLVTVLQHPEKARAKVQTVNDEFEFDSCLGTTPHQIRGYISNYNSIMPYHMASSSCTACSQKVLDEYKAQGLEFLLKVFNEHDYLENICGLTELQASVDLNCVTALSDSGSDF